MFQFSRLPNSILVLPIAPPPSYA